MQCQQLEILENAAAIRIQAAYRGMSARRMVEEALEEQLEDDQVAELKRKKMQKKR